MDCVVEVASLGEYHKLLERLRALGFREDTESGIICRYVQRELILDVMPIDAGILSFTNRWYADGMTNRHTRRLPGGEEIQIFSLPYVIASKIEAFKGRGNGDFYGSKDVEDIVTIFDGATSLEEEILSGPIEVRHWISKELASWMKTAEFRSAVEGHISDRLNSRGRTDRVMKIMSSLVGR